MHEPLVSQEAYRETRALIDRLTRSTVVQRMDKAPVCLVCEDTPDGSAPEHSRLTRVSPRVARTLAGFGLRGPVSLARVSGFWWVAEVDAAHLHSELEFGGAYCNRVVSTAELGTRFTRGYVQVIDGPFVSEAEARAAQGA
ncbi:hypothetical protein [Roseateles sp. BYS87W]|uniref:Uncharacterized protein n=1 Tax=Pelomonas baiyunensis TaxID=3299026 RepID=A0ABW7H2Y4_9BURK